MDKLTQAIDCAKSGDKVKAQQLLTEVIQADPRNDVAWLWMSGVVGAKEQQMYCLEQALKINPNGQHAEVALSRLKMLKNQPADQVQQSVKIENPTDTKRAAVESNFTALPLPDISQWFHGFAGWSILDTVVKAKGTSPELGILIAESDIAKNRIFGWSALFVLSAVVIGVLTIIIGGNPLIPGGIAFLFLLAAFYRVGIW